MSSEKHPFTGWTLWFIWVLVNTFGFAIGIGVSSLLLGLLGEVISFTIFGLVSGSAQWLILRKHFPRTGWWILASTLSAPLAMTALNLVHKPFLVNLNSFWKISLGFAAVGLIVGLAQAIVLHNRLKKIGGWVLAGTIGWFLGGLLSRWVVLPLADLVQTMIVFALIGLLSGAITGLVLHLLLKQPPPQPKNKTSLAGLLILSTGTLVLFAILYFIPIGDYSPISLDQMPVLGTPPACLELPPLECSGSQGPCDELVFFEPVEGVGYQNYPENGETWEDQYRSFLRRDLAMAVKYAAARVACETKGWQYQEFDRVGLGDMSEATGDIPGTSHGSPGHPPGTHTDGADLDIAYFQINIPDSNSDAQEGEIIITQNRMRSVCRHIIFGRDTYHCMEEPEFIDPWRTALMIAYISQHPNLRVIGVDGQVGLVIDDALDQLVQAGWIDPALRSQIPLVYEVADQGYGFFNFHHHHMHISINVN